MLSRPPNKSYVGPCADVDANASGAETTRVEAGSWWLVKHIVNAATLAITLAAAWMAGSLGIGAFWVIAVVVGLLVAGTLYPVTSSRRQVGIMGGLWSEMVDVFDCRMPTLKTRATQLTGSLTSSIEHHSDVLPSWVRQ